jgi:hypothetical protein
MPPTTSSVGAATGIGVPSPSRTKRAKAEVITAAPPPMSTVPLTRAAVLPGNGLRARQRVSR